MKVVNYLDVEPTKTAPGVAHLPEWVVLRKVTGEKDGASFTMRVVEYTSAEGPPHGMHEHPWEHQTFIVSGQGAVLGDEGEIPLKSGDVVFIPANEPHTFANRGNVPFLFIDYISAA